MAEEQQNEPGLLNAAGIPDDFKGLRACLRCALIKTYTQVCLIKVFLLFVIVVLI